MRPEAPQTPNALLKSFQTDACATPNGATQGGLIGTAAAGCVAGLAERVHRVSVCFAGPSCHQQPVLRVFDS